MNLLFWAATFGANAPIVQPEPETGWQIVPAASALWALTPSMQGVWENEEIERPQWY